MSKTVVSSDNAPAAIGPYSPGIQTGNMVFLSGQLGIDPATGKMPEGVEAQAKQSLANVEALLTAAGATFADVVKTTVYLADIADFAAVNEIYASKFEAPFPARSAFQVAALPAGGLVEIEVVADALEQGQCFVQLDGCRIQQCIDIVQARFVGRFALQA